ncbi:MAG: type II secretion system protein N [Pseudomonadota bacterium]
MQPVARLKSLATGNWPKLLVVTTSVVLVLLIAGTLARLVWLVVEGSLETSAGGNAMPVTAPLVQRPQYTPETARNWKLFGDAATPVTTGSERAPATSLSLQLLGTFSTGNDRLSGAVIAERGKEGELFRIGAAVPGGATLEKVEADKVLLRRRGQLEALAFDAAPIAGSGGVEAGGVGAPQGLDIAAGFRGLKERLTGAAADAGDPGSKVKAVLANLAHDIKDNPDAVLGEFGLKAASGGGYLVGESTNADAVRNLGLRPGDVVLSVNGQPLGNVQNDARLVDEVKASGEARVEIRRGSQTFTVNYPL